MVIRPSLKLVKAGYTTAALLVIVATFIQVNYLFEQPAWLPAVAALAFLWPLSRHFRQLFTKITIEKDKLRYETGVTSKSTRSIQLSKIQDIRVDQTLIQRFMAVGDLSIETAGETSRLTIRNIDAPQEAADRILEFAQKGAGRRQVP